MPTRQQIWAQQQRKRGRCIICGARTRRKCYCAACNAKRNEQRRARERAYTAARRARAKPPLP